MRKCVIVFLIALCNSSVYAADEEIVWNLPQICSQPEYKNECFCSDSAPVSNVGGGYSVDMRKYVSDSEWAGRAPYKYLLKLKQYNEDTRQYETGCTGNMIRGKIVTARHCLDDMDVCDGDKKLYSFYMADGTEIKAQVRYCSDVNSGVAGDWVIFDVAQDALRPIVQSSSGMAVESIMESEDIQDFARSNANKTLVSSGFDSLKVMPDAEIDLFHKTYMAYIKNFMPRKAEQVRWFNEASMIGFVFLRDLEMSNQCRLWANKYNQDKDRATKRLLNENCFEDEADELSIYDGQRYSGFNYAACGLDYADIFNDGERMKVSTCSAGTIMPTTDDANAVLAGDYEAVSNGNMIMTECQSWSGRSGGGLYLERGDNDYSLVGTVSAGLAIINRKHHAAYKGDMYVPAGKFVDKLKSD